MFLRGSMVNWTLEERETAGIPGKVLAFVGELTLPHAATIREALLAAVECGEEVTVECDGVTAVDLCGLQLLCSVHRTAASRNKRLTLARPLPPSLLTAVTEMGFTRHQRCLPPFDTAS